MKKQETSPKITAAPRETQVRIPGLVLLKAASKGVAIFVAHGIGDTARGLLQLATRMQVSQPVYGIQARGPGGIDEPLDRIEDMAEFHVDAIPQLRARGPYVLVGYSLGGLVMLKVARRLSTIGGASRHLHNRFAWIGEQRRIASRIRARDRADRAAMAGTDRNTPNQPEPDESIARAWQHVKHAQYRAWRVYNPASYDGKVKFVRAAIPSYFPADPVPVWSHLVGELEVETVPGLHLDMLTTQVGSLAAVVGRYVCDSHLAE